MPWQAKSHLITIQSFCLEPESSLPHLQKHFPGTYVQKRHMDTGHNLIASFFKLHIFYSRPAVYTWFFEAIFPLSFNPKL